MKLSPALAYLASNPWAMEFGLFSRLSEILDAHAAGDRADPEVVAALKAATDTTTKPTETGLEWIGRTAVVPIRGALARYASSVNGFCQPQGRSAEAVQSDLMAAAERGAERIILRIDSPGGEVAGTAETAAMVRHIGATIPTIAFVDGLCASAAFWIASQASEIVASADTAQVGSIGIASVIRSGSGNQTVITSAPAKSSPVANDAHIANAMAIVADLATAFADAVAAGRGLSAEQAAALATGEVWTAQRALGLGLIDRIASWDQVIGKAPADPTADPARRQAIAAHMAATVAITRPSPASAAEITPTPAAAVATAQESTMDAKTQGALTALSDKHPTLAASLVKEACKPGATADSLEAFAAAADAKTKLDALVAERDQLRARAEAAEAKAATAEAATAAAEDKLAKATAHATPHGDLGGDEKGKGPPPTFTKDQLAAGQIPKDVFASGNYVIKD